MLIRNNPNIRPAAAGILAKKHILTGYDAVTAIRPRRYFDYTRITPVEECVGKYAAVSGRLIKWQIKDRKSTGGEFVHGLIAQGEGPGSRLINVMFFQGPWIYRKYSYLEGQQVVVAGKVDYSPEYGSYTVSTPDIFTGADEFKPQVLCVYPKYSGLGSQSLSDLLAGYINLASEPLEPEVLGRFNIPEFRMSLYRIHYPQDTAEPLIGESRLVFNDLLYFAMSVQANSSTMSSSGIRFTKDAATRKFIDGLPFRLTADQQEAIHTVTETTRQGKRCDVLLQGDVGCGKTIVAAALMMEAAENGYQSILVAPRSVLAEQHYNEIKGYADRAGIRCVFLHSGMKAKEKKEILSEIADGRASFIIGTHACLSEAVTYRAPGLLVTDEEHLFGVAQKEAIKKRADTGLHCISMSATPIPRTLSETIFGESKKVISIKTKPAGRKEIITTLPGTRNELFSAMYREITAGHQCYVVCPAIEENDDAGIVSVEHMEQIYRSAFSPLGITVGVVHGGMKKEDISAAISGFVSGQTKILISTTVIEVGVNVPNATVMAVEQADRFGLASLHQLRGRVGRSDLQSYCFLISDDRNNARLLTMVSTNDGFRIAEADLMQRGTGNLLGSRQSGYDKYVDEMFSYPEINACAREAAAFCLKNRCGGRLMALYREHEEAELSTPSGKGRQQAEKAAGDKKRPDAAAGKTKK